MVGSGEARGGGKRQTGAGLLRLSLKIGVKNEMTQRGSDAGGVRRVAVGCGNSFTGMTGL